ncbi:hypothetical protein EOT10_30585 [Streptomyces antnestii]|uniref:DUF4760 domain-containing protein n=1 Tax=Streptomyces antnestii TaxID=2494256 RepID=A0A437P9A9_9ACTN|nr:hypothetical protein [Streptomyces sp. San01]RVU18863.1 hypothetical protein EOT10_30585 [Streptomyces sp. San01]
MGTAVGGLAALLGLGAVIVQLRHLTEGIRSSARSATYDVGVQIKLVLLEHPQLRPFFFDNEAAQPDHPEASRIASLAELYCMYFQELVSQGVNVSPENRTAWHNLVTSMYRTSPPIRSQLARHLDWYSTELRAVITRIQAAGTTQSIGTPGSADSNPARTAG